MKPTPLTETKIHILHFVLDCFKQNLHSPSIREIANSFKRQLSTSYVVHMIIDLEIRKLIVRRPGHRGIVAARLSEFDAWTTICPHCFPSEWVEQIGLERLNMHLKETDSPNPTLLPPG